MKYNFFLKKNNLYFFCIGCYGNFYPAGSKGVIVEIFLARYF